MTTRLEVTDRQSFDLNPLENAIEAIEQRSNALLQEVYNPNPDPKLLQPVLTGSVSAVVNVGPMAICKAFLGDKVGNYSDEERNKLRNVLLDFLDACRVALDKNLELIVPEENELHEKLVESYTLQRSAMENIFKGM